MSGYTREQLPAAYERLLTAVRSVPRVTSAPLSHSGFGTGISRTCCVSVEGKTFSEGEDREVRTNMVLPNYFETLGLPLLAGRGFSAHDVFDEPRFAVVSRTAAGRYFGEASPIGRRFGWGEPGKARHTIEVVGVVEDASIGNLREELRPVVYFRLPAVV